MQNVNGKYCFNKLEAEVPTAKPPEKKLFFTIFWSSTMDPMTKFPDDERYPEKMSVWVGIQNGLFAVHCTFSKKIVGTKC